MKAASKGLLLATFIIGVLGYNQNTLAQTASTPSTACFVDGISDRVRCGDIDVPENYQLPNGKLINIHYVVLPAQSRAKQADPLLILAGGPGQAATELAPMINRIFAAIRRDRDIVLIDQRGTGQSHPLRCDIDRPDELTRSDENQQLDQIARACLAQYPDTDMLQYHTVNAVRDFERVRQHLGIAQWNLYGGSYGTRVGLTYLREAPEAVRTATLDSVAPNQVVIGPFGRHGADSFRLLLEDCRASSDCRERFPHLAETYQRLMDELALAPVPVVVKDPQTNQAEDLLVTANRFSSIARMALYSPFTRQMLPYMIDQTAQGNYQPLVGLMGSNRKQNPMYVGLTLSVLCSEDMARASQPLLQEDGNNGFIGSRTADAFIELCSEWPVQMIDASWSAPVSSDKPVLLLAGRWDPVTPPAWAELAAQTLTHSKVLVAKYGAHTIVTHTCANEIVADFIAAGELSAVSGECLQEGYIPAFITNSNGAGL
ncbi:alpha/beta hydrolase [Idiomarina xiamenensis]|uniref:Proline iminopeptidase n=1 Tax=Idiomarina xiamenensis 10-D-4 TaxID=740709 RepID=K2KBU3_9GAMM|nr:alpha/beta hydrolase [Idiomarina xiamenensis]EKE85288.1 peptidase [Idiomarina xiamenensis 10-D-4]